MSTVHVRRQGQYGLSNVHSGSLCPRLLDDPWASGSGDGRVARVGGRRGASRTGLSLLCLLLRPRSRRPGSEDGGGWDGRGLPMDRGTPDREFNRGDDSVFHFVTPETGS